MKTETEKSAQQRHDRLVGLIENLGRRIDSHEEKVKSLEDEVRRQLENCILPCKNDLLDKKDLWIVYAVISTSILFTILGFIHIS